MSRAPVAGSPLVRLLGEWIPADATASGMDFAERLSLWLGALDAIALQGTHQAVRGMQAAPRHPRAGGDPGGVALQQELERARNLLAHAIAQPLASEPAEQGYAPYAVRHAELQRRMELAITPLRAHVREVASRRSMRLRQLAALDATFEQALAARAQGLLAALPGLLKQRFEQLRAAAAGAEDNDWLQAFDRDWRQALRAELEVRLAPVAGLVEAAAGELDDTR